MRLGDFRKLIADLPDDYILDNVLDAEVLPGYYDGYPIECISNEKEVKYIYTNEPKIRFIMLDLEFTFYDVSDENKTYEENLKFVLNYFVRGSNVSDYKWEWKVNYITDRFYYFWNSELWQERLTERKTDG